MTFDDFKTECRKHGWGATAYRNQWTIDGDDHDVLGGVSLPYSWAGRTNESVYATQGGSTFIVDDSICLRALADVAEAMAKVEAGR